MMKKVLAAAMALGAAAAVTLLVLTAGDTERASAAGVGPNIALGTVSGTTVPVEATTLGVDPYVGFNLHISTAVGGTAVITTITSNANGSILKDAADPDPDATILCAGNNPAPGERVYGCTSTSTTGYVPTTTGVLANFVINATGNGCVAVELIEVPDSDPQQSTLDTYTVNQADSTAQSNVVSGVQANVLIGTGTVQDCPGLVGATPTFTPTNTNTPGPTNTPTNTPIAPTATPCSANGCPTPGRIATSTNTPEPTATVGEPAPGGTTAPPPPPSGSPGAGGTTPTRVGITLPDTGDGSGGGGAALLWTMLAVAAIALGGGTLAVARRRR